MTLGNAAKETALPFSKCQNATRGGMPRLWTLVTWQQLTPSIPPSLSTAVRSMSAGWNCYNPGQNTTCRSLASACETFTSPNPFGSFHHCLYGAKVTLKIEHWEQGPIQLATHQSMRCLLYPLNSCLSSLNTSSHWLDSRDLHALPQTWVFPRLVIDRKVGWGL